MDQGAEPQARSTPAPAAPALGHNRGPALQPTAGHAWRHHCWDAARAALLPTLPIEVVRLRVRRAAEIGLDYRTYAGIRATTGHDLVAFLFSTNALALLSARDGLDPARATRLRGLRAIDTLVATHPPLSPEDIARRLAAAGIAAAAIAPAPGLAQGWRGTRAALRALAGSRPADGVLVIGATALEQDWPAAARMAGYLPADRYFGPV
jgi:hypothetical protein